MQRRATPSPGRTEDSPGAPAGREGPSRVHEAGRQEAGDRSEEPSPQGGDGAAGGGAERSEVVG